MKAKIVVILYCLLPIFILFGCKEEPVDTDKEHGELEISFGYMQDRELTNYKTVKIGTQVWMAENLKTIIYNDGTAIPNVTDDMEWVRLTTGAYCNNGNDEANVAVYGRLYNGYAVATGKLAPRGWHVATNEDWTLLQNYLIENGGNYDGTYVGHKIAKSLASNSGWDIFADAGMPGNDQATNNSSGFAGLPGGKRYDLGVFYDPGNTAFWWTSTVADDKLYGRNLNFNWPQLMAHVGMKEGQSVRCVQD